MLSLTRKTDYALVALAALAEGASEDQPLSAARIARDRHLPAQVLMKVLKNLQHAGLIASTRGAHGGYYLTRGADRITLGAVIDATEGAARLTPCCVEDQADACLACQTLPRCTIRQGMRQINERLHALFEKITLGDLLASDFGDRLARITLSEAQRSQPLQEQESALHVTS